MRRLSRSSSEGGELEVMLTRSIGEGIGVRPTAMIVRRDDGCSMVISY
jgi:hypothetical protein